ncbi:MAG: DHA2 family efflux MFS transporter permease subunit [Phycisphaerales bacterium]|nr:DHA2 family efflux MFS transporter permease subunit [Phycisphaerales bacterium]
MNRDQVHARRWWILGVLILALFGVTLDNTILNVALPTLAADLEATAAQMQWMVNAFVLVFAGLLLVAGALSDRYGRRLALVIGLAIFGLGSALAPLVATSEQLIALRALLGLGAAFTMPSTLSIIADVFGADERPKAIAAWGMVSGLGIVAGPIVGGWLIEHYAWQAVFLVNVPLAVVGIPMVFAVVPESKAPGRVPLDPAGATLSIAGLVALVFGIISIPEEGWTSPVVAVALTSATGLLTAFVWWERRVAHPMLDVRLFGDRRFSAATISVTLVFFSLMGALFFLTQYLQGVLGLSALETGLWFIPLAVGLVVASPLSAVLTTRVGARITTAAGLAIVAVGLGTMATLSTVSGQLHVASVLFVAAFGVGLAMTPATDAIMGAVPREQFGVGSAVNDTTREVGGALGIAVLGSIFAALYASAMSGAVAGLPAEAAAAARQSLASAGVVAATLSGEAGATLLASAQEAFVDAMAVTSLVGIPFSLAGVLVALAFLPARATRETHRADASEPVPPR